jgi:hypothetical protein
MAKLLSQKETSFMPALFMFVTDIKINQNRYEQHKNSECFISGTYRAYKPGNTDGKCNGFH